jgi:glycosyltransferase involved in cell wall biosynthesis
MERIQEISKRLKHQPQKAFPEFVAEIKRISLEEGIQSAYNRLLQTEVYLNLRKPKLGIYDHAFHFIGGAQKYGLSLISTLKNQYDITIISNKEVTRSHFKRWYDLDLDRCKIKIIKLPYFEKKNTQHLDPASVSDGEENPFHLISKESGNYDIFINNSMNEMVYPLSNISVLICHFPERRPRTYFYADRYTHILYNSKYTGEWIRKIWGIIPNEHIYPPVDMEPGQQEMQKKKTIISVARFEVEGTKKQWEMIETFLKLKQAYPKVAEGWSFKLVGGSDIKNPYLQRLKKLVGQNPDKTIKLEVNIPLAELKSSYRESTLFWHLCGLAHADPSEIEHFGMTAVEAMQNKVVPLVFDGGGLKEIVDHGKNGFRVRSRAELLQYSLELLQDEALVQTMAKRALEKSQEFSRQKFEERVHTFFARLLSSYNFR